jgi:TPR repeat protein
MNTHLRLYRRRKEIGAINSPQLILLGIGIIALLALVFWFLASRQEGPTVPPPPPTSKQAVPEIAREVITEQQEEAAPDYVGALDQARALKAEGKLADAQLLYFFSARGGYAPAAFELAGMYDPTRFDPAASLMDEPDAFQAYKWYLAAQQGGIEEAAERLAALRTWAEAAAEEGDFEAEQLLLQWE